MDAPLPPKDEEIDEILSKAKILERGYRETMSKIQEGLGLSSEELEEILSNPDNFTPDEWKEIQKERQAALDDLGNLISPEEKEELLKGVDPESEKKKKTKKSSSRQQWIQM